MNGRRERRAERFFLETRPARILLWILGVGLGTFLVGYLLTALIFFPGRRGTDVVTVPDLRGRTEAESRRLLDRLDLELATGTALPHPEVPAGAVLAQTPLPGREVAVGSTVRVILSAGPERRPVPEVGTLSAQQAQSLLARLGFEVEVVEVEDARRAGSLLEVRPAPGTLVDLPGRVELVISLGPPPVEVPDLTELSEWEARERLAAVGLRLGEIEYEPWTGGLPGDIASQRPAAGMTVPPGSRVNVTIVGSPEPQVIPPR